MIYRVLACRTCTRIRARCSHEEYIWTGWTRRVDIEIKNTIRYRLLQRARSRLSESGGEYNIVPSKIEVPSLSARRQLVWHIHLRCTIIIIVVPVSVTRPHSDHRGHNLRKRACLEGESRKKYIQKYEDDVRYQGRPGIKDVIISVSTRYSILNVCT